MNTGDLCNYTERRAHWHTVTYTTWTPTNPVVGAARFLCSKLIRATLLLLQPVSKSKHFTYLSQRFGENISLTYRHWKPPDRMTLQNNSVVYGCRCVIQYWTGSYSVHSLACLVCLYTLCSEKILFFLRNSYEALIKIHHNINERILILPIWNYINMLFPSGI